MVSVPDHAKQAKKFQGQQAHTRTPPCKKGANVKLERKERAQVLGDKQRGCNTDQT